MLHRRWEVLWRLEVGRNLQLVQDQPWKEELHMLVDRQLVERRSLAERQVHLWDS